MLGGKIRIVALNANSLKSEKKLELSTFIDYYQVDIVLISETHFASTHFWKKLGYSAYSVNHPSDNARGGAAILVRNELRHYINSEAKTEAIQAI